MFERLKAGLSFLNRSAEKVLSWSDQQFIAMCRWRDRLLEELVSRRNKNMKRLQKERLRRLMSDSSPGNAMIQSTHSDSLDESNSGEALDVKTASHNCGTSFPAVAFVGDTCFASAWSSSCVL